MSRRPDWVQAFGTPAEPAGSWRYATLAVCQYGMICPGVRTSGSGAGGSQPQGYPIQKKQEWPANFDIAALSRRLCRKPLALLACSQSHQHARGHMKIAGWALAINSGVYGRVYVRAGGGLQQVSGERRESCPQADRPGGDGAKVLAGRRRPAAGPPGLPSGGRCLARVCRCS